MFSVFPPPGAGQNPPESAPAFWPPAPTPSPREGPHGLKRNSNRDKSRFPSSKMVQDGSKMGKAKACWSKLFPRCPQEAKTCVFPTFSSVFPPPRLPKTWIASERKAPQKEALIKRYQDNLNSARLSSAYQSLEQRALAMVRDSGSGLRLGWP